ncbi:MAG: RNA methyltransferase [Acidimicrobiales bacterium]|nr:RNA methyltransferase [Acidimicrobiales bacterium]
MAGRIPRCAVVFAGQDGEVATTVEIDDPTDPLVAVFMGLRDHDLRRLREAPGGDMEGVFVAEGETVAGRALAAGYRATVVLVDAARDDPLPPGLGADVPVVRAGPSVVTAITGYQTHRGALVALARRPLPSAEAVLSDAGRVVVTEAVVNPTNLGVIVRSAAALGLDAVLLDPTSCDPLYRRANRASMGLGFALPHARLDPLPDGLAPVRDAGFAVVALTPSADAVDLRSWADGLDPDDRVALVLGSEGPGLTAATEAAADVRATIPLAAGVDSLNVGVAAGIACYLVGRP